MSLVNMAYNILHKAWTVGMTCTNKEFLNKKSLKFSQIQEGTLQTTKGQKDFMMMYLNAHYMHYDFFKVFFRAVNALSMLKIELKCSFLRYRKCSF